MKLGASNAVTWSLEINGVLSSGFTHYTVEHPHATIRIVIAVWNTGALTTPLQSAAWNFDTPLRVTNAPQGLVKKIYDKYITLNNTANDLVAVGQILPTVRKFKFFKNFKKGLTIDFGGIATTTPSRRLIISMSHDQVTALDAPSFIHGYWATSYEDA